MPAKYKTCIPCIVRPEPPISLFIDNHFVQLQTLNTRKVRKHLSSLYFIPPKCKLYFQAFFNISDYEWNFYFRLPFVVTMETRLQDFQWKVTHNILYTNAMLYRMRPPLVNSSLCTFCKLVDETPVHLFIHCKYVKTIWNTLTNLWGPVLAAPDTLSGKQIIFGDHKFSNLLNHVIIIIKQTIYSCKMKGCLPSFNMVKININTAKQTERYIMTKNNLSTFEKKWGSFCTM